MSGRCSLGAESSTTREREALAGRRKNFATAASGGSEIDVDWMDGRIDPWVYRAEEMRLDHHDGIHQLLQVSSGVR
jgi:hypothetical protein